MPNGEIETPSDGDDDGHCKTFFATALGEGVYLQSKETLR
jgi:hypothetical protein